MPMDDFVLGIESKVYYGAAGAELGTLTELANVRDVTVPQDKAEADGTTRGNAGYAATIGTLKRVGVEFEMNATPGDSDYEAVRDAYLANDLVELAVLSGDRGEEGTEGPKGSFSITQFNLSETNEGLRIVAVVAKLALFDEWVEIAGS